VERRSRKGCSRRDPEISRGGRAGGAESGSPRRAAVAVTGAGGEEGLEELQLKMGLFAKYQGAYANIWIAITNRDSI
jgi:hypothetical protein